jgi:hypothetical protein
MHWHWEVISSNFQTKSVEDGQKSWWQDQLKIDKKVDDKINSLVEEQKIFENDI